MAKKIIRVIKIVYIFSKYNVFTFAIDSCITNKLIKYFLLIANPFGLYFSVKKHFKKENRYIIAKNIKIALEKLGPIFIKLGQTLSTRSDLLEPTIRREISKLQDKVKPIDVKIIKKIIENELSDGIDNIFSTFIKTPLASASIAQVHKAQLESGEIVAVKVIKPKIKKIIDLDISIMKSIAKLLMLCSKNLKKLRLDDIVKELEYTLNNELDLTKEAANTSVLKRNFQNSKNLFIPKIYWTKSTKNLITMDYITGIPINDLQNLKKFNVDLEKLAKIGVEIFFTQVFKHRFFHADMHPGNIFVSYENAQNNPKYIAIDCGIIGTITEKDRYYLAENFIAFFDKNYRRMSDLHVKSGWIDPKIKLQELENEIRAICEPMANMPIKQLSIADFLIKLFNVAKKFDMQPQPQLMLLQKTLFNIEGIGKELYPELDIVEIARPLLKKWTREDIKLTNIAKKIMSDTPGIFYEITQIPKILQNIIINTNNILDINKNKNRQMKSKVFLYIVILFLIAIVFALVLNDVHVAWK